jgi:hypothetical protein
MNRPPLRSSVPRALAFMVMALTSTASTPSLAQSKSPEELGLDLVPGSRKLDAGRYASGRDYDGTLKFFRDRFKGQKSSIKWSREVSLPTVKYIHLENLSETGAWQGVNIYQLKTGETRIFLLPRVTKMTSTPVPTAAPSKS